MTRGLGLVASGAALWRCGPQACCTYDPDRPSRSPEEYPAHQQAADALERVELAQLGHQLVVRLGAEGFQGMGGRGRSRGHRMVCALVRERVAGCGVTGASPAGAVRTRLRHT